MENGGYVILNFKEDMDANLLYEKLVHLKKLNKPIKIVYDYGTYSVSNFASFYKEVTPSTEYYYLSFVDTKGTTTITLNHRISNGQNTLSVEHSSPLFITVGRSNEPTNLSGSTQLSQATYLLENYNPSRFAVLNFSGGAVYNSTTLLERGNRIYLSNYIRKGNTLTFNFTLGNETNIYYVKAVVNADDSTITFTTLEK